MEATPDAWWRVLPWAVQWEPTDVCHECGHVRWKHERDRAGVVSKRITERCLVPYCTCGPILNRYHKAGYVGPRDTISGMGRRVEIDQPAPPRRSIKE